MADQDGYQHAMREAANAAWDHDWDKATRSYQQALNIVPDDSQALAGLALSLMESGYHDRALQAYERVSQLVPSDPLPYEKAGQILESIGRKVEAAKKYVAVAEIYYGRKDIDRAMPYWQVAVDLDPDLLQPHMRLAVAYERSKETYPSAIFEYLELARLLQKHNQISKAEQALQRAQKLDPLSADLRNAVSDLKRNAPIQRPQRAGSARVPRPGTGPLPRVDDDEELLQEGTVDQARSPLDEAARYAMSLLADIIWSGQVPSNAQGPLLQAIDMHQIGDVEGALAAYSKAFDAGLDSPALRFNLGLLYQAAHRTRDAINLLSQASTAPEYALAANLAIGLASLADEDMHRASRHLLLALQAADQSLNPHYDASGYERMLSGLEGQGQDQMMETAKALAIVLDDARWRDKLSGTFAGYVAQGKENYVPDLIELLVEGGRPEIAEAMERVEMFLNRDMLRLAMEEVHFALERSPDYLPAHRAIADIMIKEGRTQDAAFKINLVANTYLVRGNPEKAADLFAEVIQLWPADVGARERVIDMLKSQGRANEVVRHYQELGDLYYRLRADPDKAIEIYNRALDYAQKNGGDPTPRVAILKSLADIESQRLNWKEALGAYEEIAHLAPDDEEAALSLVDLHFRMGNAERGVRALDTYMRYCVTSGHTDRIVRTLEEQVRRHPDEASLRQRLADVYLQQKRLTEAIAQMDALGELYLDSGRKTDAIDTIRKIISLNPPDVDGYHQLLQQLES